ncbi:hypothetical protein ACFLZ2_04550 [Candidatus Margulisiibacteriota bacterium]
MNNTENVKTCAINSKCGETPSSFIFLFVGLVATISIRLVNFILDFSVIWAKMFWYIGVGGFTIYFVYKYRQYKMLQKELEKSGLIEKLTCKDKLSDDEYGVLKNVLCQLGSRNTAINYFVIFLTSGIALLVGIFQDFIVR